MEKLERVRGGRRPAALAGGDRPVLPGRPDLHVADHPADVLRASAVLRAPVLAGVPPADGRVAGHPDHRGHTPGRSAPSPPGRTATIPASRTTPRRSWCGSAAAAGPRWWPTAELGHRGERAARRDAVLGLTACPRSRPRPLYRFPRALATSAPGTFSHFGLIPAVRVDRGLRAQLFFRPPRARRDPGGPRARGGQEHGLPDAVRAGRGRPAGPGRRQPLPL